MGITLDIFATSKNAGPTDTSPPSLIYIGTDLDEAVAAVETFVKYEKDSFPDSRFPHLYSAIPLKSTDWQTVKFYSCDGWWKSIVKFEVVL